MVGAQRTIRIDTALGEERIAAASAALGAAGASATFVSSPAFGRTYATIDAGCPIDLSAIAPRETGVVFDAAIIALAIEPLPQDALWCLAEALGGAGRPAGIVSCDLRNEALLLEFRPEITSVSLVLALADVELRRWGGQRRTTLLSPLGVVEATRVAAEGLHTPEIAPDRVLEVLLEGDV